MVATQPAPEAPKTEIMAGAKDAAVQMEIASVEGPEDAETEPEVEEDNDGNADVVIVVEEPCHDKVEVVTGGHEQLGNESAMEAELVAEGVGDDIDVSSDADPPILE